ncbi:MAG: hypothetical protein U0163_01810 [Gemmatimonadaceae bacterium]
MPKVRRGSAADTTTGDANRSPFASRTPLTASFSIVISATSQLVRTSTPAARAAAASAVTTPPTPPLQPQATNVPERQSDVPMQEHEGRAT